MARFDPERGTRLYLALDQGGHASRALVFDSAGQVLARGLDEVGSTAPSPDRVEQDPDAVVASLEAAIAEVAATLGPRMAQVAAAGLATQRSSIVCWDRHSGAALSPVLSWQDRRARDWLAGFRAQAEDVQRRTGLVLSPHYGASKLRWCLDNLPEVARAAADGRLAFGPLASFLVFRLVRERPLAVDPANAARTLLWNLKQRDWDDHLLALFGLPRAALPACVGTRHDFGHLAVQPQIPLTILTGDQSAALFAFGAPHPESAYVNIGTGAFVQRPLGHYPGFHARLLTGIVYADGGGDSTYVLEGTVNGAGGALSWLEQQTGLRHVERELPAWLASTAEPPLFLNGVGGLGAPYWVADFVSRFIGEALPWQQAVAVVESVVFLLVTNLEAMRGLSSPVEQWRASGGLTRLDGLCQRLANVSNLPVYRPVEHEATARGTAWLLAGGPTDWPELEPGQWFRPRPDAPLLDRYRRWTQAMAEAVSAH